MIKIEQKINTYSNIHSHDFFSILDGHSSPEEILKRCDELGIKSVATTNHGNEFSFYYYAKLQKQYPHIKILYGVEFYEAFNHLEKDNSNRYFHLIAIAKNDKGIQAIHELVTKSNFEGFYYKPRIDLEQLKPYADDLIITNACIGGKLGKIDSYEDCIKYINEYKEIFGDSFYLEMQVHQSQHQIEFNKKILKLSQDTKIPYIITNDNHYTQLSKQRSHAYFVNINSNNADIENTGEIYDDCYIHSIDEIYSIMAKSGLSFNEITIGLENTNIISDMCNGKIEFSNPELPHIKIPKEYKSEEEWFQALILDGWSKKIEPRINGDVVLDEYGQSTSLDIYKKRINEEFETIKKMQYIGYHLIVQDFIMWAKSQGIAVGEGRGSAVGALTNYLLGITGIDPIPNNLLFSRYLNIERVSNPDIDTDFESKRRIEVFNYLKNKYGEDYVAQIINFTYISPKVAVTDAGRCLGKPIKDMKALSEFMTQDTIKESIEDSRNNEKLRELLVLYQDVIDLAEDFDNRPRSLSINACGTIIASNPIYTYCGMMMGEEGEQLLQVDKVIAEELGMTKMDLLGLKTLDIINDTLGEIEKDYNYIEEIPIDDEETFNLLSSGMLCGVFQLEGYNMTKFFQKLKAKNLEDICAGISLYRPGAMQYIDNYLAWKEDNSKIIYLNEKQRPALQATHGCMVYQEQVQQILSDLAGFSYAQGDLVRRGMAKKQAKYVLDQRDNFIYGNNELGIKGSINNEVREEHAIQIFKEMAEFAKYAFNKSHGFAYAKLTYYTAYLKCHYPLEFMVSLLSHTSDNTKISQYLTQCNDMGLKILNPDINNSDLGFKIFNNSVLYGIGSLNNVGKPTVEQVIKNRPYASFQDFLNKNSQQIIDGDLKVDKSAQISLINGGCFDALPLNDNEVEIPSRDMLLGKVFYNSIDLISKVSTTNIPELFENNLIKESDFFKEKEIYNLHKTLLSKKNKLDVLKDDDIVVKVMNNYTDESYQQDDDMITIVPNKYKKEYEKYLSKLKENLKENAENYSTMINKIRVMNAYIDYKKNRDTADLEFESTSFYFQDSWLNTSVETYGVDEYKDIPNLNMEEEGYYKKKQLYTIVGTLTGKTKKHKEITMLTNSGIIIAKLGDLLYNTVASDLSRGDKIALSGYVGDGFFRAEYYENGKSNKLKAIKVINC